MNTCCWEDVVGHHYPLPRAHRNRGDPLVLPPLCRRNHKPMPADQQAIPVAFLVRCVFERLKTKALTLARWNPELLLLSGILLHMPKVRDKLFSETNSSGAPLESKLAIRALFVSFKFCHQITIEANWSCPEDFDIASTRNSV